MSRARPTTAVAVLVGLAGLVALVLLLPSGWSPVDRASADVDVDTVDAVGPSGAAVVAAGSSAAAVTLLRRAADAEDGVEYQGDQEITTWHDGRAATRTVTVTEAGESTATANGVRALTDRTVEALLAAYVVRVEGAGTVLDRPAHVVTATQDGVLAARMWLDDGTGLMLRQDVVGAAGEPRRSAAFVSLTLGGKATTSAGSPSSGPSFAPSSPSSAGPSGWTVLPLTDLARWGAEGWPVRQSLPGGMRLLDARRGTLPGDAPVLQLTYGDGICAISVFAQRGELADELSGWQRQDWDDGTALVRDSWPETMTWQGGDLVITAVGDLELDELQDRLADLPHDDRPGVMTRFARSALSWLPG
ncbi:sigma-E factor regulatory protein RseB domain-containing protein [Spongisporangium articulatum]|uniref:Sigma-E factor regulatory protein RseB domain-containing protein n=1 Tax=Spongisporangium articulatum TaxID=3362603 RepID=A0ABW8AQ55_9ACTN